MTQLRIPAVYMRGGTSKGVFFIADDLPRDAGERDRILLRVVGSPDPYGKQIDGMGAATSSTSKVVILSPSRRAGYDVDYRFGQVAIDRALVDWSGNCGNLTAAVGPFALSQGWVAAPADGIAVVRIWQENIARPIVAHVPVRGGQVVEEGDFELDGVTFPAAEIRIEFLDPGGLGEDGGEAGRMLPTGRVLDVLDVPGVGRIEATLISAGNPTVIVEAQALGIAGTELQAGHRRERGTAAPGRGRARPRSGGDGTRAIGGGSERRAAAHAEDRLRVDAARLRRIERQAGRGRRHRSHGAHALDGQDAPCGDRNGRDRARRGGRDPGHAGRARARRQGRSPQAADGTSLRCRGGRRASGALGRRMESRQGDHEPQRPPADGRMGADPRPPWTQEAT